jgi:anti-sigma-K factor RskA
VNIKEYISSGILESYVLGVLTDQEKAEVEKNLRQYPDLQRELRQVEDTQEEFLMKATIQPRAAVKIALLKKIDDASGAKTVSITRPADVSFWRFAAAASIAMAVLASFLAYQFWNKWQSAEFTLLAYQEQNRRISEDYNQVNKRLNAIESDLDVIADPRFKRVLMTGTPNSPEALASVYWNESTRDVYVQIQHMKALSQEQQYQLWAFIDGKPIDAGVFDGTVGTLVKMKQIGKGAVKFAVTIEPRGGKPTPSVETIQVIGDVPKS